MRVLCLFIWLLLQEAFSSVTDAIAAWSKTDVRKENLSLQGQGLTGTLPDSLWNITSLKTIDLSGNAISGPIPDHINNLVNLETLNLFDNALTGSLPSLSGLRSLKTLILRSNKLSGAIPSSLGGFGQLQVVDLKYNRFTGTIPAKLGNSSALTTLALDFNQLSGPIPKEMSKLSELLTLTLSVNSLSGPLPRELGSLGKLQWLALDLNRFEGPLPSSFQNLSSLQSLTCTSCGVSGALPPWLATLPSLTILAITGNPGVTGSIPSELGSAPALQSLDLSGNRLEGAIPVSLGRLSSIRVMSLGHNGLTGSVPAQLGDLSTLTVLYLHDNQLTGSLPSNFSNMPVLGGLYLQRNRLTGQIPDSWVNMSSLTILHLSNNQLSGPLPPGFGDLPNLYDLDVSNNQLAGAVPTFQRVSLLKAAGNLFSSADFLGPNMLTVDLSRNLLEKLPAFDLSPISSLNVAENRIATWPPAGVLARAAFMNESAPLGPLTTAIGFKSPVPHFSFSWQPSLTVLNVSHNPMLGLGASDARAFLQSLSPRTNLVELYAANCSLQGNVLSFYYVPPLDYAAAQPYASTPDASGAGGLNAMLGMLQLSKLDLSHNNITGFLVSLVQPIEGAILPLQSLDLSFNNLGADGQPGLGDDLWNLQLTSRMSFLSIKGNPQMRAAVKAPQQQGCLGATVLTAQADARLWTPTPALGYECTTVCSPRWAIYVSSPELNTSALCRCLPGWSGSNTTCSRCPVDTYSEGLGEFQMQRVCTRCPTNSSTAPLDTQTSIQACKCAVGLYLDMSAAAGRCVSCSARFALRTTLQPGASSQADCKCFNSSVVENLLMQDLGELGQKCSCPQGMFMDWRAWKCRSCTEGQLCTGDLTPPLVLSGFWAQTASCSGSSSSCPQFAGHSVYRCYSDQTCLGDRICAEGRGGKACSLCNPGYYGGPGRSCSQCPAPQTQSRLGFALGFALVPPVALGVHVMNRYLAAAKARERLQLQRDSIQRVRVIQVAARQLDSHFSPRASHASHAFSDHSIDEDEVYRQARSTWFGVVYTALFQIVQFVQLVSVMTKVETSLPPTSSNLFAVTSVATTSIYEVGGVACMAEQQSSGLELGIRWGFPFIAIALTLLTPYFARAVGAILSRMGRSGCCESGGACLGKLFCRQDPVALGALIEGLAEKCSSMDLSAAWEVVAKACCSYFLNVLVNNGLLLLTCVRSPNGKYSVQSYPHIDCPGGESTDTQEFYQLLAPCLIYSLIFVVAVPLGCNYQIFRLVVQAMARSNCRERGRWANFCGRFRDPYVHWLLVVVAKDLLMNIIATAFVAVPIARRLLFFFVADGYALWSSQEKPFNYLVNTWIEAWLSHALAFTAFVLGLSVDDAVKDALLIVLFSLAVAGPFCALALQGLSIFRRTAWLVPQALQPQTSVWKKRHLAQTRELLPGSEEVLRRFDNVELLSVCGHLTNSARFSREQAMETQGSWTNLTLHRLRAFHRETQADVAPTPVVPEPSAASRQAAVLPVTALGKSGAEDTQVARGSASPTERDGLLLLDT